VYGLALAEPDGGIELGKGRELEEILADLQGKVAEGVRSTAAALGLAARYGWRCRSPSRWTHSAPGQEPERGDPGADGAAGRASKGEYVANPRRDYAGLPLTRDVTSCPCLWTRRQIRG